MVAIGFLDTLADPEEGRRVLASCGVKVTRLRSTLTALLTQIPINVYSTKKTQITSRLLVGCHTQASGYFWRGNSTVLSFGGPPLTIG